MRRVRDTTPNLHDHYLGYIAMLNERRLEDLQLFVAERLTYNGEALTLEDYRRDRQNEFDIIPDLRFTVSLLVVDEEHVAAKLDFDCTPARSFLGLEPTGASIRFTEHVFYRFTGGRIVAVMSLVDLPAIQRQLMSDPDGSH